MEEKNMSNNTKKNKLYFKKYKKIELLGHGSYGKVYKVELEGDKPGIFYALKQIINNTGHEAFEGFEKSGLREISILKELNHENIEKLIDTFYGIDYVYLALEYLDCQLGELIAWCKLEEADIKNIFHQIMCGLAEIHNNGILHRDLAPSNILISSDGVVKIADFGLSRFIASPNNMMTGTVTTLSFRAPEILFGARYYSFSLDIWSAGCIFAQMLTKNVLFPGKDDIEVLKEIFSLLGVRSETNWPDAEYLPNYELFKDGNPITIEKKFSNFSPYAVDLLQQMLVLDPNKRITANDVLRHPYFTIKPLSSSNQQIANIVTKDYKKIKNERKAK